jgi:fatty-acyl-CoA synthase
VTPAGTPAERRAELEKRYPRWRSRAIHEWFADVATAFPDRDFIVTDDRTFTYRETAARVERMAGGLAAQGVVRGDHVAVLLGNHAEHVVLKYALSRVGAVLVPLNPQFTSGELAYALRQSRSVGMVTLSAFRGQDYLAMLDEIAPSWNSGGPSAELPDLRFVVQHAVTASARPGVPTLDAVEAAGADVLLPEDGPRGDDVSLILYTSGTTGSPKGVMWTHDQDARLGYGGALSRAFGDGWRVQSALPFFHAFANNEVLNAAMFAGGAVIPRLRFDAADFLQAVERHRPDEIVTVPTMVVALCEESGTHAYDTGALTGLMSAGSVAPSWLWTRAVERLGVRELTTGYGMTETGGGQVMSQPEDGIEHVSTTVGRIKYGGVAGLPELDGKLAEIRTADPVTGELLADGTEGELISRGPTNAVGYWDQPEETAATFRDGWVWTGDLGRVLPDGAIVLTGRKKELIRSGGENYSPKEVEDLLTTHPAVSQAFVVGLPDDYWGEIACAWLVLESGARVTEAEILAFCREHLAGFKRPRLVRFIGAEALPKTPTGKVQKFRLAEMGRDSSE